MKSMTTWPLTWLVQLWYIKIWPLTWLVQLWHITIWPLTWLVQPSQNPLACLYKPRVCGNAAELLRGNPCRVWLSLHRWGAGLADSSLISPWDPSALLREVPLPLSFCGVPPAGALWWPRWMGWGWSGKEVKKEEDICIHRADSLSCSTETNTAL